MPAGAMRASRRCRHRRRTACNFAPNTQAMCSVLAPASRRPRRPAGVEAQVSQNPTRRCDGCRRCPINQSTRSHMHAHPHCTRTIPLPPPSPPQYMFAATSCWIAI
eukprot:363947-Chlamydomonas_euryale.AAC.7